MKLLPKLRNILAVAFLFWSASALAAEGGEPASDQVLYLPIYSHVYYGDPDKSGKPLSRLLSAHVSIRNTDARNSIRVLYARYYDTDGKLLKDYLSVPKIIPPLATVELFVPRADSSGGSGANFLIAWRSEVPVNPPLVEAVHAEIEMARTLIFTTTARPVNAR
ncbi:DUF3124 domain-containing protein [Herbaspirillum sp. HC18]|nr:DUF3124 domain-containing protein [Herbaspirillum sp. HC18]